MRKYEPDNFIFTKVKDESTIELYKCYSDPITIGIGNVARFV
ncbi:MAG: hypothetical protein ACREV6_06165 [Clostridium sp.]